MKEEGEEKEKEEEEEEAALTWEGKVIVEDGKELEG